MTGRLYGISLSSLLPPTKRAGRKLRLADRPLPLFAKAVSQKWMDHCGQPNIGGEEDKDLLTMAYLRTKILKLE